MESELLDQIGTAVSGLSLPEAADLRGELATNPNGAKYRTRKVKRLKGLVWHQALGWGSVEAVAKYHTGKESHLKPGVGVESIAYTWAIRRDGQIVLCNDLEKAPWSQGTKEREGDENAEFMSVMLQGMFKGPDVTDPSAGEPNDHQIAAALALWRVCRASWEWSEGDLYGHYHFGKPSCPGNTLRAVIDAVRSNATRERIDLSTVEGRQQALENLGFYKGKVDGKWGPRSKGALIRFQERQGLVPDGVWGPKTTAAMKSALP